MYAILIKDILGRLYMILMMLYCKLSLCILQICSNINTCVCDMGFGGHDCSKIVPTFPPPFEKSDPKVPTTKAPDVGVTPSNTYIRKYFNTYRNLLKY